MQTCLHSVHSTDHNLEGCTISAHCPPSVKQPKCTSIWGLIEKYCECLNLGKVYSLIPLQNTLSLRIYSFLIQGFDANNSPVSFMVIIFKHFNIYCTFGSSLYFHLQNCCRQAPVIAEGTSSGNTHLVSICCSTNCKYF